MKKITFILFALITGTTFAQTNNATATVNLELVSPISLSGAGDLNFGKISKLGTSGFHDVVVTTGAIRTYTGNNPLIGGTATTIPTFTVTNYSNVYNVATAVTTQPGTGLVLSTITTDLSDEANASATSFKLGATLTIDDGTAVSGVNNNGVITVTVNYN